MEEYPQRSSTILFIFSADMTARITDFQIFIKPGSYRCNLVCDYCYYLDKATLFHSEHLPQMKDSLLETYIARHIEAYPGKIVQFSWHGGEPTLLGLDYFRRVVLLQKKLCPPGKTIANGIQTNGSLLDDTWARFLAKHRFSVGLSLDGPRELHDLYRRTRLGNGSHDAAMRGYNCLLKYEVPTEILCVVNDQNVMYPLQVYDFFTSIKVKFLSFLPLVEPLPGGGVSQRTVPPEAYGAFLCTVFDQWLAKDIGRLKVQIFEEAARTAFGQDHSQCLFRPTCGDIPVVEFNGDVFACDHFVEAAWHLGNINDRSLSEILASKTLTDFGTAKQTSLPQICRSCEVLAMCNGECPKNRFIQLAGETAKGNYLCPGYKLFFNHCTPFIQAIASQWRKPPNRGRNEPCPCGNGRKLKKCCGGS